MLVILKLYYMSNLLLFSIFCFVFSLFSETEMNFTNSFINLVKGAEIIRSLLSVSLLLPQKGLCAVKKL